jgi:formylglycine-generating enzyme required for sulfatase activity
MSRHETTNQQYCDYLNYANSQGKISISDNKVYGPASATEDPRLYCYLCSATTYSQIEYSDGAFHARVKYGRDMSDDPMLEVTWYGAAAYCNWRSSQEGYDECYDSASWACDFSKKGYRLPTEAEWEYAARGGHSGRRFPWGDTISHDWANYCSSNGDPYDLSAPAGFHPNYATSVEYPFTAPVGSFADVGYCLCDMVGNVPEWCNDRYDCDYYQNSPTDSPTGPVTGEYRVLRGGDWWSPAKHCRLAKRDWRAPEDQRSKAGFRVVLDLNCP